MAKRSALKPGDVVQATCVITDKDTQGRTYIHATPGAFGIVLADDFDPKWPVIDWADGGGGYGTCNTDPSTFKRYSGRVVCVVG